MDDKAKVALAASMNARIVFGMAATAAERAGDALLGVDEGVVDALHDLAEVLPRMERVLDELENRLIAEAVLNG